MRGVDRWIRGAWFSLFHGFGFSRFDSEFRSTCHYPGTNQPGLTLTVGLLMDWKGNHHEISAHIGGHQEHEHP
jgi:hypothetical protein